MGAPFINKISFDDSDMLANHMGEFVNRCVAEHGDKPAFSCILPTGHSKTLSYNEIGRYSDAVAVYLREELGLKDGDVVAVQSPNVLAYPVLIFGIMKAGLKITNVNPLYTADETNHQLKDSGAKVWFVIDVFGDRIAESVEGSEVSRVYKISLVDFFPVLPRKLLGFAMRYIKKVVPPFQGKLAGDMQSVIATGEKHIASGVDIASYTKNITMDDVAIYQYTGGTTGRSKGAELTHRNVVGNISQNVKKGDLDSQPNDALILIIPLYHVFALAVGAINSMHFGCHVVLVPVPRPLSNLKIVFDKFRITIIPGVNTLYQGLLKEKW
ncbi:MAG: AMP-binding protein, partial [Kordiimonadaceae bacterium]|nr:AMP-binding protein [Kordiimonadaceae bacterium]